MITEILISAGIVLAVTALLSVLIVAVRFILWLLEELF